MKGIYTNSLTIYILRAKYVLVIEHGQPKIRSNCGPLIATWIVRIEISRRRVMFEEWNRSGPPRCAPVREPRQRGRPGERPDRRAIASLE